MAKLMFSETHPGTAPARAEIAERAAQTHELMRSCRLCPRSCAVDRTAGEKGFCELTDAARCFREVLHYGEESELIPSHQIYFAGCNLRCEFCAVGEWNASPDAAPELDIPAMRECILRRRREGARTLNLLGGEPTVSLFGILKLLAEIRSEVTVLWNSNMYFSEEAARLLDGMVDIYLADFKCGNRTCAEKIIGADDYMETVRENLQFAHATADLIVRALVLPGHFGCCLEPTLRWIKETMPDVKVSLRPDYLPPSDAVHAPGGFLDGREYAAAVDRAEELNLNVIR